MIFGIHFSLSMKRSIIIFICLLLCVSVATVLLYNKQSKKRHVENTFTERVNAGVISPEDIDSDSSETASASSSSAKLQSPTLPVCRDRFEEADVISSSETKPDAKGYITRVKILKTNQKYPLIRVEETIAQDSATGKTSLFSQRAMVADHVLVKTHASVSLSSVENLADRLGGFVRRKMHSPDHYLIAFPNADIDTVENRTAALAAAGNIVALAEPDHIVYALESTPNDPSYGELWGMNKIDMPKAWDISTGTGGVVVGVIDTGCDLDHPDLISNLWVNTGEIPTNGIDDDLNGFVDDVHGYDFRNNDGNPSDDTGHGTHVAGTIGAVGNNGIGVAGVNWSTRIMILKFLGPSGGYISDAIESLNYAVMMKQQGVSVRLTNNSWGDSTQPGYYSPTMHNAIEASKDAGMLFVTAAGNNGKDNDAEPIYPASYDSSNIITVANTTSSDGKSGTSNYGATSVDLGAPGTGIHSTTVGGGYGNKSGTSMASPHVAGVAALIWELMPDLSWQEVQSAIFIGTDSISSMQGITVTGGRLNAFGALSQLDPFIMHTPLANTTNTAFSYPIDAVMRPVPLLNTNQLYVLWNTNGSTNVFQTNLFTLVTNDLYRANIPAHPVDTTIHYMIHAQTTNGMTSVYPTNAPAELLQFGIVEGRDLMILGKHNGSPAELGVVDPDYGSYIIPSGNSVTATAELHNSESNGHRYVCSGWTGMGSVPSSGTSNAVTFQVNGMSALEWQWSSEFTLTQTSSVPEAVNTSSWWLASSAATTETAVAEIAYGGTNFMFTEWLIDGSRYPDTTNVAPNPAGGFIIITTSVATAVYIDENTDDDSDGLGDWWERRYFGNLLPEQGEDPDGDGYLNLSEFADKTNPRNSNSVPAGPVIEHTSPPDPMPTPSPWDLTATVTDNDAVSEVEMRWRRNGLSWNVTDMTTNAVPDEYTAQIPSPHMLGDFYEYKIEATDEASNLSETGYYSFTVAYPLSETTLTNIDVVVLAGTTSNVYLSITNFGNTDLVWRADVAWTDDFDGQSNAWTHSGSNDMWHISSYRSYSEPYSWYCGEESGHEYGNDMDASLITPEMTLKSDAMLTFMYWARMEYDLEDFYWDGGIVEISTNGGIDFVKIYPVGGYPHRVTENPASPFDPHSPIYGGDGTGWLPATFDLSAYSGQVARIRFRFGSDHYTVEEGWYIDDVAISSATGMPFWITPAWTNGTVKEAQSHELNLQFNAAGIATGDRESTLRIFSNDPLLPTNVIPITMRVRSVPVTESLFAWQSSTNGEGFITISNSVSDADDELCGLHLEYSTDAGVIWTSAWINSAQASLGTPTVSNGSTISVCDIVTTNASPLATNQLTITWATTNSQTPILINTGVILRARAWDGIFWSDSVTSAPFTVDNEAPTAPTVSLTSHSIEQWSSNAAIGVAWDAASDGIGGGVRDYRCFVTNALPQSETPALTTTGLTAILQATADGTNWHVGVLPVDIFGNAGEVTNAGAIWVDTTAPGPVTASVVIETSDFGDYVVATNLSVLWAGFDEPHSGISNYFYSLSNGGGTTNGQFTLDQTAVISGAIEDATNRVFVWARDNVGLIGETKSEPIIVLSPSADFDHDGLSNSEEEVAGTDANSESSVLTLALSRAETNSAFMVFSWESITGRTYSIDYTPSLTNLPSGWQGFPDATNLPGEPDSMSFTDTVTGASSRFYRINVSQP